MCCVEKCERKIIDSVMCIICDNDILVGIVWRGNMFRCIFNNLSFVQ